MEASPLLDIIIVVSRGAREHLEPCLESLERHPLRQGPMTVHVVDNASEDGTVELVRERFPWVELKELGWNAGFCIANNVGLQATKAPFALVLNPDTEASEGALDHMIDVMRDNPRIGMSGCRLVKRDGTLDHAAKRSFPTPLGALSHFVGLSFNGGSALGQYLAPEVDEHGAGEVDAVNGAFMLVRREAVEEVGLFDQAYWLYMEDLDWCYRFHQHGWLVWYDGSVSFVHVKGGTTVRKRHRGLRHNWAFHRGMGRFYRKFHAGERPVFDALVYAGILTKFSIAFARSTIARRSIV
jgi:N-acetylglucosaminyl-diphospho-decaprenol L-rhamnosyltransferase